MGEATTGNNTPIQAEISIETIKELVDAGHDPLAEGGPGVRTDRRDPGTGGGVKHDTGKPPMWLLPRAALEGTARGLGFGEKKYGAHNWREGMDWSRVISSLLRHTVAFMDGEDIDSESGLPHVHLMGCNITFLQTYYEEGLGNDDRYKSSPCGQRK